ncbi:MAG: MFS transporter [Pseudomonadota bacterium]
MSNSSVFILVALGTVVALAGTDLVLPAIPSLPDSLGGTLQQSQWVLAAFAAGTGIGLLIYGEAGARFGMGGLLVFSLLTYAATSVLATFARDLVELTAIRFLQGLVAAGPAVFAPMMINALYDANRAVAMLGRLGSIESITPALAPILGAWLLYEFGWRSSFYLTGVVAGLLGFVWLASQSTRAQFGQARRSTAGFTPLLKNGPFLRAALSQAFTLGALLIVVFAAPTVVTASLGGELRDFVVMQVTGILFFVLMANTSHKLVQRFGDQRTIFAGTATTAFGCICIALMGASPDSPVELLWFFSVFVNIGLGIRGPAGFYRALHAAEDNESRGSALVILAVMLTTALGTVMVAPFVDQGLMQVGMLASLVALVAVWLSKPQRV